AVPNCQLACACCPSKVACCVPQSHSSCPHLPQAWIERLWPPVDEISILSSPFCATGVVLVQVPARGLVTFTGAGAGVGPGVGPGTGCGGRNMKYPTMPRARTAAATIPRIRGTLDGRLDFPLSAGAVGGGNCTATVA